MKLLSLLLFFMTSNAFATTWATQDITDPLDHKAKCSVKVLASTGSYVYHYPSKYDQVFSPFTSTESFWYCENSGFISLMGDFEGISEAEIEKIKIYLKSNKPNLIDNVSKIKHLEAIYNLRTKDNEFRNRLKRIIAYIYEQDGKVETANRYRKEVLDEIKIALKTDLEAFKVLEYLYLASNYEKQLGNTDQSEKYISELQLKLKTTQDEEVKGYLGYLSKLIEDTAYIKKGGILKPTLPNEKT